MRRVTILTIVLLCGGALSSQIMAQTGSVWNGVYTEAQAAHGAGAYAVSCAGCHGAALTGTGEAPPLQGAQFVADFSELGLDRLFDRIRTTMPQDKPRQPAA